MRGNASGSLQVARTYTYNATNDTYTYDVNGNVTKIVDGRTGGRATRTMTYDGLDRLKTAASTMFGNAAYSYDVLDNLTRVTVGATANLAARDHHYCYDAKWQLVNVKTGGCSGTSVIGLSYDVQGNLANRNGYLHTFDYGNRLRLVTYGGAWVEAYRYDAHGRRVRSNNGTMLRSVYSNAGELLHQRNDRTGKATDYVMLNGNLVASVDRPLAGGTATVSYQHTDALGSPVAVSNASRVVTETSEYEPFGRVANRAVRDGVGYTGHAEDAATGLTYMQQRYYDPMLGKMLSVDPVTAYQQPITNFCRYCYARNNPYKFTDPDGRDISYVYGSGTTEQSGKQYMISMMFSPTAHSEMRQMEGSSQSYTVVIDNNIEPGYDPNTRTVKLNPSLGLRIKSTGEVQSPKVNGGHEISHGAEHDRVGDKAFGEALKKPTNSDGTKGVSPEEKRATNVEQKIGRELGEPTRKDYQDAGGRVKCNPKAGAGC